jgi:hypothetical protein
MREAIANPDQENAIALQPTDLNQLDKSIMRHETLQLSGIAALLSGACIALMPLDSIGENLLGVVVAFTLLNLSGFLFKPVCEALRTAETKRRLKVAISKRTENTPN